AVNMLQCNISFVEVDKNSLWASNSIIIIQYIIMLIVAISAFVSNFSKNRIKQILLLCFSALFLIVFCFISYKRQSAESIFAVFPLLAVGITPIIGKYVDNKGKAASMLMIGSILLIICHLTFAFILPLFKDNDIAAIILAFVTILILGSSFSLVPASLWPSVPKLVDSKVIGSAYALIFWIQNIGLWLFPVLIGKILKASNPNIEQALADGTMSSEVAAISYNYTNPLLMLAFLGVAALILGFVLKTIDKKKGYGLELPNIKK
ncbi:MAG: MFS transporter, partial [Bacteroidales bacterium]